MDAKAYAAIAGITPERVRQLARAKRIKADLIDGRWEIEYEGRPHRPPSRRPLSQQSRSDLLRFFVTMKLDHVKGVRKQRLAARYRELLAADSKSQLLLDWWGGEDPEGSFAERNFILAAQRGDEEALAAMLTFPRRWLLSDPEAFTARLSDRLTLLGLSYEELADLASVPVSTARTLARKGEGYGFIPKLRVLRAVDLQPTEVHSA